MAIAPRNPITPPVNAIPGDRALNVREEESRKYVYRPPGQLPEVKKNPDWTHRWCRFRVKAGVDDPGNMGKHKRDGYEPAKYELRHDVLENPDAVFPDASGNIVIGDLVLCLRASYISKARKQYYEDLTKQQIRGAQQQVTKHQAAQGIDPRHGSVEDSSKATFQSGRTVDFSDD